MQQLQDMRLLQHAIPSLQENSAAGQQQQDL
jgi:hypothetical protein